MGSRAWAVRARDLHPYWAGPSDKQSGIMHTEPWDTCEN